MRKKILLLPLLFFFMMAGSRAQNTDSLNILMAGQVQAFYNSNDYDLIFEMFSDEMQTAMPLDKTMAFFSGLKTSMGKLKLLQYVRESSPITTYKANFDKYTLTLNLAVNQNKRITGMFLHKFDVGDMPILDRNKTKMKLPFEGEWKATWGGDTPEQNYHITFSAQRGAIDFLIADNDGKSFQNEGHENKDYYAWEQKILAPCDGIIVMAIDGVPDNAPGEMNYLHAAGNSVMIKTDNEEYILLAHLKQGSVMVEPGDQVVAGQEVGLCGNSGSSTAPHLHFHIQNTDRLSYATGAKCYFEEIKVNGRERERYSPIQGDKVSN